MDRNRWGRWREQLPGSSLSARRAWIEISMSFNAVKSWVVALRKESVDRNGQASRRASGAAGRSP